MGFIRGGLSILLIVLLFISVLLGSILLIMSWSLEYENVQRELVPIAKELTENQFNLIEEEFNLTKEMERVLGVMEEHCKNEYSYVFSEGGYTFVVPCDTLDELEQNPDALVEEGIESIIEEVYYEDYDCDFWDCFVKTGFPLFLVSEKAKNYWKEKFYFLLIASLVLIVLIFLLLEQKQNTPIIVGSVLVISSFILTKFEKIVVSLSSDSYLSFINVFFSRTASVFWITFIFGLVILGAGIVLRLLNLGNIKKKFSKKDVKGMVKKEIAQKEISKKETGKKTRKK